MYTKQEISRVRETIEGKFSLNKGQIGRLRNLAAGGSVPRAMMPFLALLETEPALYQKISQDKKVEQFSAYGFFPAAYSMVYESEKPVELKVEGGTRGSTGIVLCEGSGVVIKPFQNGGELGIARLASSFGGPLQLDTRDGFISEEFAKGDFFSRLPPEKKTGEALYAIGKKTGEIFRGLHAAGIYYNDTILSDDLGRSHVIVQQDLKPVLFDYGVAINVGKHPDFSKEDEVNFWKTLPGVNFRIGLMLGNGASFGDILSFVRDNFPPLGSVPKNEIFRRDLDFIGEGVSAAAGRLGISMALFLKGFKETYAAPA